MTMIRVPKVRTVKIRSDYIRLDQFLKYSGIAGTGSEAKSIVANGDVTVNGETVLERGKKLRSGAIVRCDGMIFIIK